MKSYKFLLLVCCLFFLSTLLGSEAFVRKFTRKPKKKVVEKPVFVPEEYSASDVSIETRYREYFLFWRRCPVQYRV